MLDLVQLCVIELSLFDKHVEGSIGEPIPVGASRQPGNTGPNKRDQFSNLSCLTKRLWYFGY